MKVTIQSQHGSCEHINGKRPASHTMLLLGTLSGCAQSIPPETTFCFK
jgi:hypothetical protein